jgi:hypothetical protein
MGPRLKTRSERVESTAGAGSAWLSINGQAVTIQLEFGFRCGSRVTAGTLADLWSPFSLAHRLDREGTLKCQGQPHVSTRAGCDPGFNGIATAKVSSGDEPGTE